MQFVMSTFNFRSVGYLFSKFQTCQSVLEKNFEGGGGKYTELTNRNGNSFFLMSFKLILLHFYKTSYECQVHVLRIATRQTEMRQKFFFLHLDLYSSYITVNVKSKCFSLTAL
jgi:hypothetical protein